MATEELKFNWDDADVYEAFIGRWSELLAGLFLAEAKVAPGGRVLDVGCGTGTTTKALAEAGAHVIGVDASEGHLRGANRLRSHPNITYELGDVRHLRFGNGEFDATVSTLALDVIPEIEQVVAEMKRVTRPGGVVASAVTQFLGGMAAFDLLIHTAAALEPDFSKLRSVRAGKQLFWPGGQAALWRKAGLTDVTEVPVVVDCEYPSFADYWATFTRSPNITSTTATLAALPDASRATIKRHVRDGYLLGQPDGPRSLPMLFRVVRGVVPA